MTEYIGVIHSPFEDLQNMPIQPIGAQDAEGEVVVNPELVEGLKDLDGFSHIYLIYHFHKTTRTELRLIPFMDTVKRGVFATRSPLRPARIGLSIVELVAVEGNCIKVRGIDVLNGTPLIDIKPYIPQFDCPVNAVSGWMKASRDEVRQRRSDDRYL
ncbi:MAG: tRNA (N6-threonylcarbamoyladenosine(37)-N6)-methyltransferase TrmO [Chitinophagales bacterium]